MLSLFPFQINASESIAARFAEYSEEPLMVTRTKQVPFYQVLSSITGSGKTVILAHTIETISGQLPLAPIVLWLSKGKVVVEQTLANLASGKYTPLVASYKVKPLLECNAADIKNGKQGLLLVATVGKFNQKDKDAGDRKIYIVGLDSSESSLWQMLTTRQTEEKQRRPLLIIYDEGHNLSNQQTQILMDLNPDALIAASATSKHPEELAHIVQRLKSEKKWSDADFVVSVKSAEVVEAGLVKKQVEIGGFTTPMEEAIDQLIEDFAKVEETAEALGIPYRPKAIYVSKTNVYESGNLVQQDIIAQPFNERQARPILIWRYLVEQKGIAPEEIAVYCDLKFDNKRFPAPANFNLFANGDSDYYNFTEGNYRHIIFNLRLQEGWDDPECGFAYIDKDMGSATQITQIVGRVLRQPGAQHYQDASLNTAHFYIRTDERGTFEEVLNELKKKIAAESPEVEVVVSRGSASAGNKVKEPVKERKEIPTAGIRSNDAATKIRELVKDMMDFRNDTNNTVGQGSRMRVLQAVGNSQELRHEWVEVPHGNKVTARWVFIRELERVELRAKNLVPLDDPKFDAKIEFNSKAAQHVQVLARDIARAYQERSTVRIKANDNPYVVDGVATDHTNKEDFSNALHASYSGLNKLEKEFAKSIDKAGYLWCRNPTSGYGIPLLSGNTRYFYPDFLVWVSDDVVAIDTKGDHLIATEAGQKLLSIERHGEVGITIRLVTEGEWNEKFIKKPSSTGYTVWKIKEGRVQPTFCLNAMDAIEQCLSVGGA
jgi:type III restriction enzyme